MQRIAYMNVKRLFPVLAFFRLLDAEGQLSLTNIAFMVILGKIATAPTLDWASLAALLVAIGNYSFTRYTKAKKTSSQKSAVEELSEKLQELSTKFEDFRISTVLRK